MTIVIFFSFKYFIFYNQSKQKNYRLFSNFSFSWIFLFFWIEWFSEFCSIYFHAENKDLFEKMGKWVECRDKLNENKRNYSLWNYLVCFRIALLSLQKKAIWSNLLLIIFSFIWMKKNIYFSAFFPTMTKGDL